MFSLNNLKLNIIGCGKVGKTLGYLLAKAGCYDIQSLFCKTAASSQLCQNFLEAGEPVLTVEEMKSADVIMIAVNDDQLPKIVDSLSTSTNLAPGTIVFHCSGAFSHEILSPLKSKGALLASLHPIKSFSHPEMDINTFEDTYCTLEGDSLACEELENKFKTIGAHLIKIKSQSKTLYHVATIFSSNYLVTLIDTALYLLEKSEIRQDQGLAMLEPLLLGAWNQIKQLGTAKALTGPIARGDYELVSRQLQSLAHEEEIKNAYKALGKLTLALAQKEERLDEEEITQLELMFT